jgi:hypothetical protein
LTHHIPIVIIGRTGTYLSAFVKAPSVLVRFNQILFFSILLAVADFAILWLMPVLKLRIIRDPQLYPASCCCQDHLSVTAAYDKRLDWQQFLVGAFLLKRRTPPVLPVKL